MRHHIVYRRIRHTVRYTLLPALFFLFWMAFPLAGLAQGNLLINPVRVVFEGNKQREEITLANTGQDTAVYAISFIQYRMTKDGSFEQIEEPDPGQHFADPFLRYFPRRVTLAPGESQVVRMQLRRDPNMIDGEYRSHLYFRAVPDERPLGEEALEDTTAIGIRLVPIFGITIPVIIRHGQVNVTATFADTQLTHNAEGRPQLHFTIERSGNISVYGDITVEHEAAPGAEPVTVGLVRGLAVYTPNTSRSFTLPLNPPEGTNLSQGRLIIRFASGTDIRKELFAETTLRLN